MVLPDKIIQDPAPRREFEFRGVKFFTRNLGATDQFSGRFVWFATDCWTHDQADGVFSDIVGAVADRFDLCETLQLWAAEKFRTPEQIKAVREIESEIKSAMPVEWRADVR